MFILITPLRWGWVGARLLKLLKNSTLLVFDNTLSYFYSSTTGGGCLNIEVYKWSNDASDSSGYRRWSRTRISDVFIRLAAYFFAVDLNGLGLIYSSKFYPPLSAAVFLLVIWVLVRDRILIYASWLLAAFIFKFLFFLSLNPYLKLDVPLIMN